MRLKKRIAYFVCALLMVALAFPAFGFTMSGDANVGRNGKATIKLTIQSELGETEFREKVNAYVDKFCVDSSYATGSRTSIVVDGINVVTDGYVVTVHTRRIDKITASGIMDYTSASDYSVPDSTERRTIENWAKGNYAATVSGNIQIAKPDGTVGLTQKDNKLKYDSKDKIAEIKNASGNVESEAAFFETIEKLNDNVKMFTFFFADVEGLTDVTITLPGKIQYYGGNAATKIDDNTMNFATMKLAGKISSSELGAEPTYKELTAFSGWVVVDTGTSPFTIILAVAAAVIVGGAIVTFCIYITKLGKKAIAEEETRK